MLKKFKRAIKIEISIFIVMLFVFTSIMHSDIFTDPFARFEMMAETGDYSHPFLYTFVIYSILFIIRKVLDFIIGLFEK